MFAYLLIGIELAILYSVFWYVFVREPRPYRINGSIWGSYESGVPGFASQDVDTLVLEHKQNAEQNVCFDRRVPRPAYPHATSSAYDPSLFVAPFSQYAHNQSLDTRDPYCGNSRNTTAQYGWVNINDREPNNSIAKLFWQGSNWLENLSVKLP
jgi:hypothetical protein